MANTYWHKQTSDKPLFPDLQWSRPENKRQAGKLLIVGGNLHGFAAPAEAYQAAVEAGIGTAKVLLPDALQKVVGTFLENANFAPSTPSGSFSQKALAEFLDLSQWADAVLLAGDFGRNSETAIVLEKFLQKSQLPIILTKDAVDYFRALPDQILKRENSLIVLSIAQLQQLTRAATPTAPIRFDMDLLQLVDSLHNLTNDYPCHLITKHGETFFVASGGQVSTTKLSDDQPIWRVQMAAAASVWWLQNSSKPFEALTNAGLMLIS